MNSFFTIFTATPPYVWGLFIYLVFMGVKALRPRTIFVPQMYVMPLVMFALKSYLLAGAPREVFLAFVVSLIVAMCAGFASTLRMRATFYKDNLFVKLNGGVETLVVSLLFFATRYVFGYLRATDPALAPLLVILDASTSGAFCGLMLGRALGITYRLFS